MFLFRKKSQPPFISAIVVAAGSSSRMGGIDKQQIPIHDIPVLVRSIGQFEQNSAISEIVLVCRSERIAEYYRLVQEFGLSKVARVVAGGEYRQASVFSGISACSERADFYAIHDGARPLIADWEIDSCIEAAVRHGAAAVGTPVKDTIKVCASDGFIESTPDRSRLVAIQTPQIFAAALYRAAMDRALRNHCVYTDDCQLVERCGHRVIVSPGSYENLKITTPEDVAVAEAIFSYRDLGGM